MKSIRSRGFTLIELLVVIAIIGLLASIILASLNTARQKGRDSRRVADLKEMANAMELANNGTAPTTLGGCTTAGVAASTCTTPDLSKYTDPSTATVCASKSQSTVCNYTVELAAGTTQNYEICDVLESGAGALPAGMVHIDQSGNISTTCP